MSLRMVFRISLLFIIGIKYDSFIDIELSSSNGSICTEYFWDMFIYREHIAFFENIHPYRWDQLANEWGIIVGVAILALPQQVHYIVDGFIWRMNGKNQYLKPIFKSKDES